MLIRRGGQNIDKYFHPFLQKVTDLLRAKFRSQYPQHTIFLPPPPMHNNNNNNALRSSVSPVRDKLVRVSPPPHPPPVRRLRLMSVAEKDLAPLLQLDTPLLPTYVRTRHNNLRCFPCCSPVHKATRFCGQSLNLSLVSNDGLEGDTVLWAEFRSACVPSRFCLGQEVTLPPHQQEEESTVLQATQTSPQTFVLTPPGKWRYGKATTSLDLHLLDFALVVKGRVVSVLESPKFTVVPIWRVPPPAAVRKPRLLPRFEQFLTTSVLSLRYTSVINPQNWILPPAEVHPQSSPPLRYFPASAFVADDLLACPVIKYVEQGAGGPWGLFTVTVKNAEPRLR